jgi:uncharacterized membrane protein
MTDSRLRRAVAILATVGVGIAGYLTDAHYFGLAPICGISHGCETVQTSQYAFLAGIPVALLGLIAYLILLGSSLFAGERALLTGLGVSLIAFAFSAYLTYRELFTIHAICSWCVSSAILFALLAAVNAARVWGRRPALAKPARPAGGELASR